MITALVLAKIAVTLAVVVGLSLVAEHVSPKLAGILAGFPHGIAIVLYFIGIEQGAGFAGEAAMAAIGGLAGNVLVALVYWRLSREWTPGNVLLAGAGSVVAFLGFAVLLRQVAPGPGLSVAITLAALAGVWWTLRRAEDIAIAAPLRIGVREGLARAGLAALIVLAVTGVAGVIGAHWAGLLAGFPVVTFPLLLIVHLRHGPAPVATIVKNFPFGLTSLLVYTLVVARVFPVLGMGWGTVAGFGAAGLWLTTLTWLSRRAGRG